MPARVRPDIWHAKGDREPEEWWNITTVHLEIKTRWPSGIPLKCIGDRVNEGVLFPTLQAKTFSEKTTLTKSLQSLDRAVQAFNGLG